MLFSRFALFAVGVCLTLNSSLLAGGKRPLTETQYDPSAKTVEMFDGIMDESIAVKVVANGAQGGNLFLTNQTQEPLTVHVPSGFVAVPIHTQFGQQGQGFPFGQTGGNNSTAGNNANSTGTGTQAFGVGANSNSTQANGVNNQNGNGNSVGFPNGFFSIPADRTLRVHYTSVCLNHGLLEPNSHTQVRLVQVEEYTTDPTLQALINHVGSGQVDQKTMQAATWNVVDKLSWQELAAKTNGPIRIPGDNYFSASQIKTARSIVEQLQAGQKNTASSATPQVTARVR